MKIEKNRANEKTKFKAKRRTHLESRTETQNIKSDMVETMVVTAFHRKRQKTQRGKPE
jgi:hypothetical protein